MSTTIVNPPDRKHHCQLPSRRWWEDHVDTPHDAEGTIVKCNECGLWYVWIDSEYSWEWRNVKTNNFLHKILYPKYVEEIKELQKHED